MEMVTGRYVFPKPNRLVIVAPGCAHCINPLTTAAGDKVRANHHRLFHHARREPRGARARRRRTSTGHQGPDLIRRRKCA